MHPRTVDWQALRFGVEIEFVAGDPTGVELLPGWVMSLDEHQVNADGEPSGSELKPPPITWADREQIRVMLQRLQATGARANWSCGLHVHVGLEPWGEAILPALLDATLTCQDALAGLLQTAEHRHFFGPPLTPAMRDRWHAERVQAALQRPGRPQSHRCGVNLAAWYDIGTVEIRYANASLAYDAVLATVELCLRWVTAVGAGQTLPAEPAVLAAALGAPTQGYPPPEPAPLWHRERMWLEETLIPVLAPLAEELFPGCEILDIRPVAGGFRVTLETEDDVRLAFLARTTASGWTLEPAQ